MARFVLSLAVAAAAVAAVCATVAAKADYSQHVLIQVDATEKGRVAKLESMPNVDVWGVRGGLADVMVHKADIAMVDPNGEGRIILSNVQAEIDRTAPKAKRADWSIGREGGFFEDFRDVSEFAEYVDSLVGNYSDILTKFEAGLTFEGRVINGVRLSTGGSNKPTFFIQANVHAREWLAPATNLWILTGLVEDFVNGTAPGNAIAAKFDWYFVPQVNVDGYAFTWTGDRLWRKNRRVNVGTTAIGVDINRNWGPAATWCTSGSSTVPSSDTYCGTGPFSEPETAAMGAYIDTLPNLVCSIDLHTYGPLILYPFQYSLSPAPEPYNSLVTELGLRMEAAINAVHGENFEAIQGSDLYPHSGGLIDYTYFTREVPSFTVELRGNSFIVPASDIVLSGEEAYEGILQLGGDL